MRKWLLKKKDNISTSFKRNFKIAKNSLKIKLNNLKSKYFERVLSKKCCFDENKKLHIF